MYDYTGKGCTGIDTVDKEIDRLRTKRDQAAEEQFKAQRKIDELFIRSMVPDIRKGDYVLFMKDGNTIEGRVSGIRRISCGITIEFDIVAYIPWAGEYENINEEISVVNCSSHPESVSVRKEDISRITKITRERFIGSVREVFENIVAATREPENSKQLELNL